MNPCLAKRAYNVIDQLMPGIKHLAGIDFMELNEVLMALNQASNPKAPKDIPESFYKGAEHVECKTVEELITELQKLPDTMPVLIDGDAHVLPVIYNFKETEPEELVLELERSDG